MQRFRPGAATANFNSLDDTVRYYTLVMGLWRRFRTSLPIAWHEFRHEALSRDFAGVSQSIFQFIGEPWSESNMRFAEKAEEPLLSSSDWRDPVGPIHRFAIGGWRNYAEQITTVLPRLDPFVEFFGYESR
jgi:hypothetical protein